jgi:alpha-ketoglutarate-dependent taurine dioxygenase
MRSPDVGEHEMAKLKVQELNPALGAQIEGLEPRIPLEDETIRQLRKAFDERGVLVFRDLDIDEDFQRYLVYTLIGEKPPTASGDAGDGSGDERRATPFLVSNKEPGGGAPYGRLLYHCDMMWAERPQPVISLYGVEVEQPSVPTVFVSMGHAWDTLPSDLRARVEGLEARHGHEHGYPNRGGDDDVIDSYYENPQSTVTPVVHRHPRTGRTLLYVSQQATIEILGLTEAENEALLEELFTHLYDPASTLQHDWRVGDLVVWDNVATQHARGTVDLEGPARTLRKVVGPVHLTDAERTKPTFSKVAPG